MKTVKLMGMVCLACTVLVNACRKDHDDRKPSKQDRNFMINAAYSNHAEVAAGQLAASKGTDASVRSFGQFMVTEHSMAQDELENLADKWDIDLPDGPDSMHIMLAQKLQSLSGYSFDTAYINSQVKDHAAAIMLFDTEAKSGDQRKVRAYAQKYLPHIIHHKHMADSIANKLQ
jgi:putative membrane protein